MSELDEKIVNSVYKLELSRPKKSMMRDNMFNVDMKRCMKRSFISSRSITRLKRTSNIMLPAKPMAMATWMRANLM